LEAYSETLALNMESPYNEGTLLGNVYKGWFVAPATTNYKFYLACDDFCKLNLGNVSGAVEDPTEIASIGSHLDYRDWWATKSNVQQYKRQSDWISMTKGEHYYMEAQHIERNGGDHFAAAVEIEQSDIIGHHHSMKEIQYISVEADKIFESTRITISNIDAGNYLLVF
jgi:hypothetical protein